MKEIIDLSEEQFNAKKRKSYQNLPSPKREKPSEDTNTKTHYPRYSVASELKAGKPAEPMNFNIQNQNDRGLSFEKMHIFKFFYPFFNADVVIRNTKKKKFLSH